MAKVEGSSPFIRSHRSAAALLGAESFTHRRVLHARLSPGAPQLLERLGWAISDAENTQRTEPAP
jgi:hypothetical protein